MLAVGAPGPGNTQPATLPWHLRRVHSGWDLRVGASEFATLHPPLTLQRAESYIFQTTALEVSEKIGVRNTRGGLEPRG